MPPPTSMWARPDAVWGLFAVPERELGVLGDVRGLDVLELACGTAYVSAWLARLGARPVAVDLSGEQLATARRLQRQLGPVVPAACSATASGCRWPTAASTSSSASTAPRPGATPSAGCPEAARLLRPGGRLVFLTNSHLSAPVRAARRGGGGGAAAARLRRGLPGAVGRWRRGVPPVARRLGAAAARAAGSSSRRCTSSSRRPTAPTTRSTRSSRRSGRAAGRPRSSGWPAAPDPPRPHGILSGRSSRRPW